MVEQHAPDLDAIFHALGDGTRRRMLRDLAEGDRTVGQLRAPFAISLAAVSKHIKVLESAGLVSRQVNWRTHTVRLNAAAMQAAHGWLADYERFWTARLDDLERLLREEAAQPSHKKGETE